MFSKKEVKQPETRKFSNFFKKLYEANKNGTKQDILLLWESKERLKLDKEINKEMFEKNQAMQVKMIIEYGHYDICYVNMNYWQQ